MLDVALAVKDKSATWASIKFQEQENILAKALNLEKKATRTQAQAYTRPRYGERMEIYTWQKRDEPTIPIPLELVDSIVALMNLNLWYGKPEDKVKNRQQYEYLKGRLGDVLLDLTLETTCDCLKKAEKA